MMRSSPPRANVTTTPRAPQRRWHCAWCAPLADGAAEVTSGICAPCLERELAALAALAAPAAPAAVPAHRAGVAERDERWST